MSPTTALQISYNRSSSTQFLDILSIILYYLSFSDGSWWYMQRLSLSCIPCTMYSKWLHIMFACMNQASSFMDVQ